MNSFPISISSFILSLSLVVVTTDAQATGIACSPVTPISVPTDVSKLWGTWYTVAVETLATSPGNVCSQVELQPDDPSNLESNITYIGSFQENYDLTAEPEVAYGQLVPKDLETLDPPYVLTLYLAPRFSVTNYFYILATAGSSSDPDDISAAITYSCGTDGTNAQLFFLSRQPYFVSPVTFASMEGLARRAINNYDNFNMTYYLQEPGWCNYRVETEFQGQDCTSTSSKKTDTDKQARDAAAAAACLSAFTLILLVFVSRKVWTMSPRGLLH